MRTNEATVLVGQRVVLVPYRPEHVPRYHAWMESEPLREQTASERLSLPQEHDMQRAWHLDDDKLTFIVHALPHGVPPPPGGAPDLGALLAAPPRGAHADGDGGPASVHLFLSQLPMVGDVNLFFSTDQDDDDDDDDADAEDSGPEAGVAEARRMRTYAECEVMIAESAYRRQGLASEALRLVMAYSDRAQEQGRLLPAAQRQELAAAGDEKGTGAAHTHLPVTYVAKIGLGNTASRNLFARLGFVEHKLVEVFGEVELRLPPTVPRPIEAPGAHAYLWPRPGHVSP